MKLKLAVVSLQFAVSYLAGLAVPSFAQQTDSSAQCESLPDHMEGGVRNQATDALQHTCESVTSTLHALPNVTCIQVTKRYRIARKTTLHSNVMHEETLIDTIRATARRYNGTRTYTDVTVDGKSAHIDVAGVWSSNDFSAGLELLFFERSTPRFKFNKEARLDGRPILDFEFYVAPQSSQDLIWWPVLSVDDEISVRVPFQGDIKIDAKNFKVMSTRKVAVRLPKEFPYGSFVSTTRYSQVTLDNREYVLPVETETVACSPDKSVCFRNVSAFSNYKVFTTDHRIVTEPPD